MDDVIQTKRCSKCGRILPITEFNKSKSMKDGRFCYCKDCSKELKKAYYAKHRGEILKKAATYRANNKEKIAEYQAEWRANNKEKKAAYNAEYRANNKEKIAARKAEYYTNNKEKIAEYRANNKEKIAEYNAEYYKTNQDSELKRAADYRDPQKNPRGWAIGRVNGYRRMDRDRGFDDSKTITAEWFLEHIAYRPCVYCGKQGLGKVGANRKSNALGHIPSNCEPCCSSCNSRLGVLDTIRRGVHCNPQRKAKHKKD